MKRDAPEQVAHVPGKVDQRSQHGRPVGHGSFKSPSVGFSDSPTAAPDNMIGRSLDRHQNESIDAMPANPDRVNHFSPPAVSLSGTLTGTHGPEIDEAVRQLLSRREFDNGQPLPRSIGVVSPVGGEGVSTIATALAEILRADYGARVCLLNFSSPETEPAPSASAGLLAEVASGRLSVERIEQLDFDTLDFGHRLTTPEWHALAHSELFARGLAALGHSRDHLIFDAPPLFSSSRSMVVLQRVDAYVLVARHGVTSVSDIEATTGALAGLECLGSVLNRHRSRVPRWFPTN